VEIVILWNFPQVEDMAEIRWFRIAIAALIGLAILAAASFWQAQQNPINDTDIDLSVPGCIVTFAPNGSSEVIKFGDTRCPK
jgi:hypothetical protein